MIAAGGQPCLLEQPLLSATLNLTSDDRSGDATEDDGDEARRTGGLEELQKNNGVE